MLSLSRGYFEFSFASYEDLRIVWASDTVNLEPVVLRLFEWTKTFNAHTQRHNAHTQRHTHTQIWI